METGWGLLTEGNGFQLSQSGEGRVTPTGDRQGIGRLSEVKNCNTEKHTSHTHKHLNTQIVRLVLASVPQSL